MDGHPRQNPAYRPATEKALVTGLFLRTRFAGDSSGSSRGRRDCGLRGTARRGRPAWPLRLCRLRAAPRSRQYTEGGSMRRHDHGVRHSRVARHRRQCRIGVLLIHVARYAAPQTFLGRALLWCGDVCGKVLCPDESVAAVESAQRTRKCARVVARVREIREPTLSCSNELHGHCRSVGEADRRRLHTRVAMPLSWTCAGAPPGVSG